MFCSPSQSPINGLNSFKSSDTEYPRHEGENIQMGSCLSILEPFLHYLQLYTKEESSEKLGCIITANSTMGMPSCLEIQTHVHTTVIVFPFHRHRKRRKLWGKNGTHKTERTWPNWHPELQQMSMASACQGICSLFQILAGGALTTDCNLCLSCYYEGLDWWLCQALHSVQGSWQCSL